MEGGPLAPAIVERDLPLPGRELERNSQHHHFFSIRLISLVVAHDHLLYSCLAMMIVGISHSAARMLIDSMTSVLSEARRATEVLKSAWDLV
jgi:hypothetical protein